MATESDIRTAIQQALIDTNQFDGVYLWGLPEEYGSSSSALKAAVIDPKNSTWSDQTDDSPDGQIWGTCHIVITILSRHEDVILRDPMAEQLLNTAINALNGTMLVSGFTAPSFTRIKSWNWEKPVHPERRITVQYEVMYAVEGWQNADDS